MNDYACGALAPQKGRQEQFLTSRADIAIYGGSAGGGKSYALLLEAVRGIDNGKYGGVIFRRTYSNITNEGALWDESLNLYSTLGGVPQQSELSWKFPSGANVSFANVQYESSLKNYHGAQIPFIGLDELTEFSERMFFYLLSRNRLGRGLRGVRPYVRATCNPDADSWVAQFIAWWIDEDGYADLSKAGKIRYFYRVNGVCQWADSREELAVRYPEMAAIAPPKSVTFIPATIYDNAILMENDPGYLGNLLALSPVERERLLGDRERGGNWKIRAAAGKVFNRDWFEIVEPHEIPGGGQGCRFWDFAGSIQKTKGDDPDYTASTLMWKAGEVFYIEDVTEDRIVTVDAVLRNIASQDRAICRLRGTRYLVRWEIEPGSAAKRETLRLVRLMSGYDAAGVTASGDKLTRALPLSAQAKIGNVKLVRGDWNENFLVHMHGQPDLKHDDIMDSAAGAFNALTEEPKVVHAPPSVPQTRRRY